MGFGRLLHAEVIKLRRSPVLTLLWVLPAIFLILDYRVFGRQVLAQTQVTATDLAWYPFLSLRALAVLWAGLVHPLLLALLPPLLMGGEHRASMWKHLHAQPAGRRAQFLAKAVMLLALHALGLLVVLVGLRLEWFLITTFHLKAPIAFQWVALLKTLGWMYLGSLPVLAFYLWVADRIPTVAVSVVLGLIGLLLTISLAGQPIYPSWQRDFIPWVLPYTCTQRSIEAVQARQEVHVAALPYEYQFRKPGEPRIDESKLKVRFKILMDFDYDEELGLKPPPPTPTWHLVVFSLGAGAALLGLGLLDAGRHRG